MLDPAYATGVGLKPVVQQPGMTPGELARMFDALFLPADCGGKRLDDSLEVVTVHGYRRDDLYTDTGLPWVLPSPNMPTGDTALLYPGTCMFEGTLLSEGRGTTRPFELIGAPGIDWRWAEELNAQDLPGVRFRENYSVPTFDKFANQTCGGVQVHLTDRAPARRHPHRGGDDRHREGALPDGLRLAAGQLDRRPHRLRPAAHHGRRRRRHRRRGRRLERRAGRLPRLREPFLLYR